MKKRMLMMPVSNSYKGYRPKYRLYKLLWEFHAYDKDPFPSVPHGHNIDGTGKLKLNINTGAVYNSLNKQVGVVSRKELETLHNDLTFRKLVITAIDFYNNENQRVPKIHYPELGYRRLSAKYSNGYRMKKYIVESKSVEIYRKYLTVSLINE